MSLRQLLALAVVVSVLPACSFVVSMAADELATNLGAAMRNQDDPETVRQGAPAYLLLVDSLIEGDPENPKVLLAGARIYDSYSSLFVDDELRARRLSGKAWRQVRKGLCNSRSLYCELNKKPFPEYARVIAEFGKGDAEFLFTYASVWIGWIQANKGNWKIVADVPKVKLAMERVAELKPGYDQGMVYLYLGGLSSLLPPALGGKPEEARQYFEMAYSFSGGKNLMAKVMMAEKYARMTFKRKLHDKLLKQVLSAETEAAGFTLTNVLAKRRAEILFRSANEYF
ncbi:MAG: hypothetical protein IME93_05775 [Proteobacteria bacterium]|nr:hypothetical protein [Pseudomonadota bacterium]